MQEVRETSIRIIMPCVRIYHDDIKEIVDILSGLGPKSTINLEANKKSFEFNEIKLLNTNLLKLLKITVKFDAYEYLTIEFSKHNIWIYCSQNTTQAHGVIRRIENLLKSRRRLLSWVSSHYIPTIILYLSAIAVVTIGVGDVFNFFHPSAWITRSLLIVFFASWYFDSCYGNVIFLQPKSSYKNMFVRNKDQLLIGIVSSIVSGIIGFFLSRFTG